MVDRKVRIKGPGPIIFGSKRNTPLPFQKNPLKKQMGKIAKNINLPFAA
jgi:hypothetical protein